MKFSSLCYAAVTAFGAITGVSASEPSSISVKTNIVFPNSLESTKLPEFINDKETPVQFEFTNNEETAIHVAGYFGSFYYNKKGKIENTPYANLTTSKIGPLAIEPGQNASFDAKVLVSLPPEDFDLIISFFVGYQGEMIVIEASPIKVTISDPPVNFFDPKFLFVQLVLGLTIAAIGFVLSSNFILPYFEKNLSSPKKPVVEKKSVNTGNKGYDESWIPSHHLQSGAGKPKTKKNN